MFDLNVNRKDKIRDDSKKGTRVKISSKRCHLEKDTFIHKLADELNSLEKECRDLF